MFRNVCIAFVLALVGMTGEAWGQRSRAKDADFVKSKPAVEDPFPLVKVYTSDGQTWSTADLRDHYAVITFGCLT